MTHLRGETADCWPKTGSVRNDEIAFPWQRTGLENYGRTEFLLSKQPFTQVNAHVQRNNRGSDDYSQNHEINISLAINILIGVLFENNIIFSLLKLNFIEQQANYNISILNFKLV